MPNVSFMAPGSELELAQQDAARQRALADALRQQSMTPSQGIQAGNMYVAPSWTQGLAKLLQGYTAGKISDKVDGDLRTARSNYDTRTQKEVQDFVGNLRGTPAETIQPLTPGDDEGNANAAVQKPAVAPDMNKAMMTALGSQNPMIQGMGGNILTSQVSADMTQQRLAKLLQSFGVTQPGAATPDASGAAPATPAAPGAAAAAPAGGAAPTAQGGIPGVSPIALAMQLSGDKSLEGAGQMAQQAFAKGNEPVVNRGFGLGRMVNGQYVPDAASLTQALDMKRGEQKIANEGSTVTITDEGGQNRTMTKAQEVELAKNNGAPASYASARPVVSKAEQASRDSDRPAILQAELAKAKTSLSQAQAAGDPQAIARAQEDVAGAGRELSRLPGFASGQSTSDKSFSQEQGKTLAEYEAKINSDAGAAQQKIVQNNKMLSLVPEITTGPFSKQVTTLKMLTRNVGVDIGDPSSNQEFEKFAIKGALEGAKQIYGARLTNQDVMSQIMSNPGSTMAEKALYQLIKYDTELQQHLLTKQAAYYDYQGPNKARFEMDFNREHPLMGIGAPKPGQTAQQSAPGAAIPTFAPPGSTTLKPRPGGGYDYQGKR